MTVYRDWPASALSHGPRRGRGISASVVTVGVFDGFHRGHESLLGTAVRTGQTRLLPTVLVTFDPHPLSVLCPERAPRALLPVSARVEHALRSGADSVVVLPFNETTAEISAEDFIDLGLVGRLGMRTLVVGENFRCGAGGRADVDFLRKRGMKHGYDVVVVPLVQQGGIICSSTEVRTRLAAGDLQTVTDLLGRVDSRLSI